jgi:hypothetical protein
MTCSTGSFLIALCGSPTSAVSPTLSMPSPQVSAACPCPTPSSCRRWLLTPSTGQILFSLRQRVVLPPRGHDEHSEEHCRQLYQSTGSEGLPDSDREDDGALPNGPLEVREREDSAGLLSPPSSQSSPRARTWHTQRHCDLPRTNQ